MIWSYPSQNIAERNLLPKFKRPTIITDLLGKMIAVNHEWEVMCKFSHEDAFGRSPKLLQGLFTNVDVARTFSNSIRAGTSTYASLINHKKDGSIFLNCIVGWQLGDILIAETYAEYPISIDDNTISVNSNPQD